MFQVGYGKILVLVLLLSGCISVSYLPSDDSHRYSTTTSLKVFWDEMPDQPYVVLGKLTAQSGDYGEEAIFSKLKKKAMSIGADGLLMGNLSKTTGQLGSFTPSYTGSGGYGYIIPTETHRMEAIAIRFTDSP